MVEIWNLKILYIMFGDLHNVKSGEILIVKWNLIINEPWKLIQTFVKSRFPTQEKLIADLFLNKNSVLQQIIRNNDISATSGAYVLVHILLFSFLKKNN